MSRRDAVLVLALVLAGCGGRSDAELAADSTEAAARVGRLTAALGSATGSAEEPFAKWILPIELAEVSGIALTADGRLVAHSDEMSRLAVIDYRTGTFVKRFKMGDRPVVADFEAITAVGADIYLLQSNGTIYQFREAADGESAPFTVHETGLADQCEFEGIAHDPTLKAFLLACKQRGKQALDSLTIYRVQLNPTGGAGASSVLSIPIALVIGGNDWKELHPSDITVDPTSGNYVLVARQERALIVITPEGVVVASQPVPGKILNPEGVAITRDGILLISDEAAKNPASISLFRWRAVSGRAAADTSTMPIDSSATSTDSVRP